MNIVELCMEEGKRAGFSEQDIKEAKWYAEITNPGQQMKEIREKEIPEPFVEFIRIYIRTILAAAKADAEFRKSYIKWWDKHFGNKN